MAPLKKKKGAKAAKEADAKATTSPKLSPKFSPKTSPAAAPNGSPKLSPKASPAAGPKAKEGKAAPRPPPTEAEKAVATKKAVELIKKGLQENPTAQDNGHPYIPKEWSTEMKPILGGYRKFLEKSSEFIVVQGDNPAKFTVQPSDGKGAAGSPRWEAAIRGAWQKFLQDVPKEDRDPEDFLEMAKKCAGGLKAPAGAEVKDKKAGGKKRKQGGDEDKDVAKKSGAAKKGAKAEEAAEAVKTPKKKKRKASA
mmetsp:Transcript_101822/g.255259  ORF Transcript_101822/g.255259 Transcript_101822/m.255259 type:complete len:252 (-) Transcript_101822:131-886(-)